MKHTLLCLFLIFFMDACTSAQTSFTLPDRDFTTSSFRQPNILRALERENRFKSLSIEERDFYYWVNLMRLNPQAFYLSNVKPFLDTFPELLGKESQSLQKDLNSTGSLPLLLFSNDLRIAADEHAYDLAMKSTRLSHESSKGMGFAMRMKANGINRCAAENLYQGNNAPLFALIMLLLDMGMETPGHRRNLLNPSYQLMGVSIRMHHTKSYYILVQDFSCQ